MEAPTDSIPTLHKLGSSPRLLPLVWADLRLRVTTVIQGGCGKKEKSIGSANSKTASAYPATEPCDRCRGAAAAPLHNRTCVLSVRDGASKRRLHFHLCRQAIATETPGCRLVGNRQCVWEIRAPAPGPRIAGHGLRFSSSHANSSDHPSKSHANYETALGAKPMVKTVISSSWPKVWAAWAICLAESRVRWERRSKP